MLSALSILIVQGLVGALDNLVHHEWQARLPARLSARRELALHAARELIYAVVFLALAWAEWRGLWAWLLLALLAAEVAITVADFLEEDASRRLPRFERALHTVLAVGYGAFLAALAPVLWDWLRSPTAVAAADHGWISLLLTLYAAGVATWGLRNVAAVRGLYARHARQAAAAPPPASGRRVLVAGGTGFIGRHLVARLLARGDEVWVLSRDAGQARAEFGPRVHVLDDLDVLPGEMRLDAVVQLSGAPVVNGRWTARRKRVLLESRVGVTRRLVRFMARQTRPNVLIAASAVGFYGLSGDEPVDEGDGGQPIFLSELGQAMEAAAARAERLGVRVALARFGVVLGPDGGTLPLLTLAARLGLGARLGNGRQFMPWVHIDDAVGLLLHLIDDEALAGPVNAVAPQAVRQAAFVDALAAALGRPRLLAVPALPLRLALGELSQLMLDGQNVVPRRALAAGYEFRHPTLAGALDDLVGERTRPARAAAPVPTRRLS